jgi:hypothetical protein
LKDEFNGFAKKSDEEGSMKRQSYYLASFHALACLLFAAWATGSAWAGSQLIQLQGQGASASFLSVDASGCIATDVFVQFGDSSTKSPSESVAEVVMASMFISQFDSCTGVQLLLAFPQGDIPISSEAAQISKKLDFALLTASVNLIDTISGQEISPEVNLTWTATSDPPSRTNSHFHFLGSRFILNSNSQSFSRAALVKGSVLLNSINITPQPTQGTLESARAGQIQIFRP